MSRTTMMKSTEFVAPMLQMKVALQRPRGVELHRMRGAHSLTTLRAAVAEMWPLKHKKQDGRVEHVLEYEDEEGDKVRLTSDAEWMEAVRLLGDSPSQAVLKLFVRRKVFTVDEDGAEDSGVTDGGAAEEPPKARSRGQGHGRGHGRGWAMRALLKSAGLDEGTTSESGDGAVAVKDRRCRKEKHKMDAAELASMSPEEQKHVLGERIRQLPIVHRHPVWGGKITGTLMEMDSSEILKVLESPEQLRAKVRELVMKLRPAGRRGGAAKQQQSQGAGEQAQSEAPEEVCEVVVAESGVTTHVVAEKDDAIVVTSIVNGDDGKKCEREGCAYKKHSTQGHGFCCHGCRRNADHGPRCERVDTSVTTQAGEAEAETEPVIGEAKSVTVAADEAAAPEPEEKVVETSETKPATLSKLPEDVQTMLSIFPYLTGAEAVVALRRARGNLGQAINGVLARAERQRKFV